MESENLIKLKAELQTALEIILPQIEGLEDFNRLNIKDETRVKVTETLAAFVERRDRINQALEAINNLELNLFPEMPDVEVVQEVHDDLKENVDTIAAAFKKFKSEMAASLGVTVGSPELK